MNDITLTATVGGLLHAAAAAAVSENIVHSYAELLHDAELQDCARLAHGEIAADALAADAPAHIVRLADRIASADGGDSTSRGVQLESIFNHLGGAKRARVYPLRAMDDLPVYPGEPECSSGSGGLRRILSDYLAELGALPGGETDVNALLSLNERRLSLVPAPDCDPDISIHDHSKLTAAIAGCIGERLLEAGVCDFQAALCAQEAEFLNQPAFLMFTADFSGIQRFIYSVRTKSALKALRSRSFFLELLMEHTIDELLRDAGVSRASLIYSGGGHCYVLLPNTAAARAAVKRTDSCVNDYLRSAFGTGLFLATACVQCSANALNNRPAADMPYSLIFKTLSRALSARKLHRYSAAELLALNRAEQNGSGRECKNCGTTARLLPDTESCEWCDRFVRLSGLAMQRDLVVRVDREMNDAESLPLPSADGMVYAHFLNEADALNRAGRKPALRVYVKNRSSAALADAICIHMCDYAWDSELETLAENASGVRRIAVLRADVDNLGATFIAGFEQKDGSPEQRSRYVSLVRTAALSRSLSLFFKRDLNALLEGRDREEHFTIGNSGGRQPYRVTVVYSGGDDVFLLGAWDAVVEAGVMLQQSFARYTDHALTISAGITLNPVRYPVRKSADNTEALVEQSKSQTGKNSVTLFEASDDYVFSWERFRTAVLGEKFKLVYSWFQGTDAQFGNAMLYSLASFLQAADERINLARFAYLLARMAPSDNLPQAGRYREFCSRMYGWCLNPEDRRELLTAIYICVYSNRKRRNENWA